MRTWLLILSLMAAPVAWLDVPAAHAQVPLKLVRVAILKDIDNFNLSIKGKFTITEMPGAAVLSESNVLWDARVSALGNKIQVGKQSFLVHHLKITPHKDATIYVNNRRFRGVIDVVRSAKGFLTVINSIELESYIKGVMYHEVSHYWPMESLKAQAVVARTYALYQMKANAAKDFDLTNDIYSQVYGGKGSERYRTNIAVDRTKGLILTFRDKILYAYYHATCAGYTEDVSELWEQDLPPLKGVPCDFCRYSPHANWKKNFRLADIQEKLNAKGYKIGLIKDIAVVERNASGRIRTLEITMRDDKKVRIAGKEFREIIGPNTIKSNNYEIVMQGYYMDLIGKGWGHGVGMCQWGASEMAREGYSYDQILMHYYPGVRITDYASLQN